MDVVHVGLIGLGTVGAGVARLLLTRRDLLEKKLSVRLNLKTIADLDTTRRRDLELPPGILVRDASVILNDPEIHVVVELIGGMEPAKTFILQALASGKHVVTANKALLAEQGNELYEAAAGYGKDLLFEASVAGGIPVIRTLKEGLAADRVRRIQGILNGTCNYILTKMTEEGSDFQTVLKEAQELGYAEADPGFDVDGFDSAHKVAILTALGFGVRVDYSRIYVEGIRHISPLDIQFAREFGFRIKLLGMCFNDAEGIDARVHPTMIPAQHMLANVNQAYNALLITGEAAGNILLYGLGAGEMPTAGAVVSDLMEAARSVANGISHRVPLLGFRRETMTPSRIKSIDEVETHYYFRFSAVDKPGVLSMISGILGRHGISIASVIQKGRRSQGTVPIVMMTHRARERNVRRALEEIARQGEVGRPTAMIRVENEDETLESGL